MTESKPIGGRSWDIAKYVPGLLERRRLSGERTAHGW
jgi:hypothetical protein